MFPLMSANSPNSYNLTRSLRFRASASAYLSRTTGTATNANKWTWSGWVKRGTLGGSSVQVLMNGYVDDNNLGNIGFNGDSLYMARLVGGSVLTLRVTNAVFRDPSAWYHIVFVFDNANATVADRVQIYVNSVLQTYSTSNDPSTTGMYINANSTAQRIGRSGSTTSQFYFDGYIAEQNFIDGQALTPSSFGSTNSTTGVWQPAAYTGTYGTNGFYLPFTDNSALTTSSNVGLGKDFSGNGNYWTTNNISITAGVTYDSMTDVPTLTNTTTANFCVMNPLRKGPDNTVTDGNLKSTFTSFSLDELTTASIFATSGKWYFEAVVDVGSSRGALLGILATSVSVDSSSTAYTSPLLYGYTVNNGNKFNNNTSTPYGSSCTTGDIVGVAFDLDNGKIWFSKNGVWQASGDPAAGTNPAFSGITAAKYTAAFYTWGNQTWVANFGQRPFLYAPPSGFNSLNAYNIAAGTVTTSGSFTGNVSADGPSINLNGVPTAMTINGNAVTFGTHADKTAYGFKLRTASTSYNSTGTNTYSITTTGAKFKYANAQGNP